MADPYAISPYGVNFLKQQEGYVGTPVWDYKQYSSGYGTRANYPGERIDPNEAERRLVGETNHVSDWLRNNVKVPLSQNQTDALISAGYNLGTGPKGLGRLLGDINGQNWDSIAARLPTFNKAGGKVNPGLVNRRAAEVKLLTGKGEMDTNTNPMLIASALRNSKVIGAPVEATGSVPVGDGMDRLKEALAKTYDPSAIDAYGTMTQQAQKIAGSSGNPIGAIGGTLLAALGGYMKGGEEDKKKAYNENQRQGLAQAADTAAVAKLLMASPDPAQQEQGIMLLAKNEAAKRQNIESVSKTPIWGTDEQGNPALVQVSDRGRGVRTSLPEGVKIGKDPIKVDAGTHFILLDPVTRQAIGQIPKDIAGAAREKKIGDVAGENIATKPDANLRIGNAFSDLDRLSDEAKAIRDAPGLDSNYGLSGVVPNRPGSEASDAWARLSTLKSQIANTVLQRMREASKTGGAVGSVSDSEQVLFQNNLAALDNAQSPPAVKAALDRIVDWANSSKERVGRAYKETYGEDFSQSSASPDAPTTPPPAGGYKVLKVH
jgi:GH24 family phage-related lysozyme (muramidase)